MKALEKTKHHQHLAVKCFNCHKRFRRKRCDRNHDWAIVDAKNKPCSSRLCPHCSHRRSKILAAQLKAMLLGKVGLRYVVLAERNSTNLQAGVKSLWKAWTSLRRSVCWKAKVKGCIVALEVTYNRRKRTWHPHLNVLMEGDYFPFAELNQAWVKASRGKGRTSRIQAAKPGKEHELMKYVLKVATRDKATSEMYLIFDDPAAIDEFLSSIYGARLLRSYGTLRGLKEAQDEEKPEECPDCRSTCVVDMGGVSYSQLEFDFVRKTFRVVRAPTEADKALHLVRNTDPYRLSTNPESIALAVEARKRMRSYERTVALEFAA